MTIWGWYVLIGLATSVAALVQIGKTSDSIAQLLPPSTTKRQFNSSAIFSALMMGIAWPAVWLVVYDNNRPSH